MWCCGLALPPLVAQNNPGGGLLGGPLDPVVLMLLIGAMFYFLLIRPERRKRQETNRMLESLKKNDKVVTIGGIYGVVVNIAKTSEDTIVTIRVDDGNNTRLKVQRSAILRVVGTESGEEKKDAS